MFARFVYRFLAALLLPWALLADIPQLAAAEAPFAFAATPGKLPKNVVPTRYVIHLRPDIDTFKTSGSADIDLQVLKPAVEIVLNALDLEITRATFRTGANRETRLEPQPDADRQTVTLKLPQTITPGKYRLHLQFSGKIGEQSQGLFYVKYSAPSGAKTMLATQMEPADARRMFPCWDEPAFRAVFELTVDVPQKYQAVSNMPVEQEKSLAGGLKEVRFAPTPPMASYLVLLAAAEFEDVRDQVDGVQLRVLTTEGKKEQGRFALSVAKELLSYYDRYFGIKYPLPKLDHIAIPGNFDGAMENWGGITYEEGSLLYDPNTSSEQTKREVYVMIAHEMAHQWFGNLVTMAWWNNLWLNEGFASWMETKATDHFNPAWQMWLSANAEKSTVMGGDAHSSTHPIQQPVANESQANAAFDNITYLKGAALLRMLESYLGPDQFQKGIHRYLVDHRYSNATTADLWAALEKTSGKGIAAMAAGWTEQPGLPVVTVSLSPSGGERAELRGLSKPADGGRLISLSQERFTVQDPTAEPLLWKIPVALLDAAHPEAVRRVLLEGKSLEMTFGKDNGPIKANAGDTGYYRVWYQPELFDRLVGQVSHLSPADRLNLLDDSWAMVEANRASSVPFFSLVEALQHDPTLALWEKTLSTLTLLDELEQGSPHRTAFQQYARSLLQPQFQRLGWAAKPAEPESDKLLRSRIIWGLGYFGDPSVIAEAKRRFEESLTESQTLSPNLRSAVLRIVGRYSDRQLYDQLHELARHATGAEDRQQCYEAMAEALDPSLARETLAVTLSEIPFPHEATAIVVKVATNAGHKDLAWAFAREHQEELLSRIDTFSRGTFIPSVASAFSDIFHAAEMEAIMNKDASPGLVTRGRETAQLIRFKAALKERELPVLAKWVDSRLAQAARSR